MYNSIILFILIQLFNLFMDEENEASKIKMPRL